MNCSAGRTGCSSAGTKQARFRDPDRTLDRFDFDFNKKMNRALIHDLATGRFIQQREDALFLGPPGTGKSHLAQAIGHAAIQQGYRVWYREAHLLLEDLADATPRRHPQGAGRRADDRARCSSSTTSGCGNSRTRRPKTSWRSSCGATNAPRRSSRPTDRSMIGASEAWTIDLRAIDLDWRSRPGHYWAGSRTRYRPWR